MKKLITAVILAVLCSCFTGCLGAENGRSSEEGLGVWYKYKDISSSTGTPVGKITYSESVKPDLLHEALTRLTENPESDILVSAFPTNVRIISYNLNDGVLDVNLTAGYSEMDEVDKIIARCCLILTLCSLEEVDSVNIYQENTLLEENLTADLMITENNDSNEYEEEITLYFPAPDSKTLYAEKRKLTVAASKSLAEYVIEELFNGAQNEGKGAESGTVRLMPEGTKLLSIKTEEGLCTVDFSGEFYTNRPTASSSERLLLYSIVNTLTELTGIDKVQITVDGDILSSYTYIDISQPLYRAEEFIKSGTDYWTDSTVNVYLGTSDGRMTAVCVAAGSLNYEQWLNSVIDYYLGLDHFWGYKRLIPEGTKVLSAEMKEGICQLNLSADFLNNSEAGMYTASRAIASTLYDARAAEGIVLYVEGRTLYKGIVISKDDNIIVK